MKTLEAVQWKHWKRYNENIGSGIMKTLEAVKPETLKTSLQKSSGQPGILARSLGNLQAVHARNFGHDDDDDDDEDDDDHDDYDDYFDDGMVRWSHTVTWASHFELFGRLNWGSKWKPGLRNEVNWLIPWKQGADDGSVSQHEVDEQKHLKM